MHLKLLFTTSDKTELDVRKLWTCFTFSSLLLIPVVHSVVFNYKSQECAPCFCAKETNPLCVNENDDKKQFVTYDNPCEFMCTALCNEYATKFMYCGKCDNRTLPLFGAKGKAEDFDCLGFTRQIVEPAGPGSGSESGEDWTNAPPPEISPELKAQLERENPRPPPESEEVLPARAPATKDSSEDIPAPKETAEDPPAPQASSDDNNNGSEQPD